MRKYTVYYWVLLVLGIAISFLLSSLIHSVLDKPRGVPLARLGIAGTVAQIGLLVFPFLFAPILTSFAFRGGNRREPTRSEQRYLVEAVAASTSVLWVFFFVVSGIWFGVLQGGLWFAGLFLLGPPIIATIAFWVLFSLGTRIISSRINK